MGLTRQCSKTGCTGGAVATLTYVYADRAAVLGPLATYAEPHTYDLCDRHQQRLTAPRGWDVVRLSGDFAPPPPSTDDLLALADAVREAGRRRPADSDAQPGAHSPHVAEVSRRGHLRMLRDR